MKRLAQWPWGRIACTVGAVFATMGTSTESPAAVPGLAIFVFAGVALHGLAIWRDKP